LAADRVADYLGENFACQGGRQPQRLGESLDPDQDLAFAFRIPNGLGRASLLLGDEPHRVQPLGQETYDIVVHLVKTLAQLLQGGIGGFVAHAGPKLIRWPGIGTLWRARPESELVHHRGHREHIAA
jgi:hypothetical protein